MGGLTSRAFEEWRYERITSGITPGFFHWILVLSLVFNGIIALSRNGGWNKTAISVLFFWGIFQTIVGVIDIFPPEVKNATNILYKQGAVLGVVLIVGPIIVKQIARVIEFVADNNATGTIGNIIAFVLTLMVMVLGASSILLDPSVAAFNIVLPNFFHVILDTPGMNTGLAIKALTLGYLVSSGMLNVVLGLVPQPIRELM